MADRSTVDGALFPFYGLPNRSIENLTVDTGVPVGFWRSVGYSLNCFFVESFIDELAAAAGAKPLDYRAKLLAAAANMNLLNAPLSCWSKWAVTTLPIRFRR
jgi:isoquinoline 1-oxidoreductase beta subunit